MTQSTAYRVTRSRAVALGWVARVRHGDTVGVLHLDPHTREILLVSVNSAHRRQGIATALYARAQADGYPPEHSRNRSLDGSAWAYAVGGFVPPLDTTAHSLYA